jgi:hypothetical protein
MPGPLADIKALIVGRIVAIRQNHIGALAPLL